MKKFRYGIVLLLVSLILLPSHKTEEGMFPLSYLKQVDLKSAGFRISESDIYNPGGIALTDALVRLGGCTGSFVSDQGLIITNHHCVFGSVANLSTKENDYLENGYYASDRSKELKTSLTCKITKSYEDVSLKVLDGVNLKMEPIAKKEIIKKNIEALQKEEQKKYPDLSIEISEMFVGYSYTLFRYQLLKDVRLVYVPPRTIGEFGGETDNWEWPKHTGDFSFVRAYVGKDGKPAEFNSENVPFVPKKHLKINPGGTRKKDLVFILGYPGATFRQEPAQFLKFQQDVQLPFISEWFGWKIKTMEELGKSDRNRYLALAGNIKNLANTKKNYEGKLYGLKQTGLLEIKTAEQTEMILNMQKAGVDTKFMASIDSLYNLKFTSAAKDMLMNRLPVDCGAFSAALVIESFKQSKKTPNKNDTAFWNKWKKNVKNSLQSRYRIADKDLDRLSLAELLNRVKKLPAGQTVKELGKIKNTETWTKKTYASTLYDDQKEFLALLDSMPWKIYSAKNDFQTLAKALYPHIKESSERQTSVNDRLNTLLPLLLDARIRYGQKKFIPDANSTLRFTYGYISAYKEGLNIHPEPYTYKKEIFAKNALDNQDYRLSTPVKELLLSERIAKELLDPETNDMVVCMLYNMDTTGGNSGSPVMDADGNLVGVNFDRAYTATLNDYSWNPDYSRSIGVDIRYVLFTMKYLNHADNLLQEMGIQIAG